MAQSNWYGIALLVVLAIMIAEAVRHMMIVAQ